MIMMIREQRVIEQDKLTLKQHELTTQICSFNNVIDTF